VSVAEAAGAAGTVLPGAEDVVTGAGLGVATKALEPLARHLAAMWTIYLHLL